MLTAEEYLSHAYTLPEKLTPLPLSDENFVEKWQETNGKDALDFLADGIGLPAYDFLWENQEDMSLSFANSLAGHLPVITTRSHKDFRQMEALLSARKAAREIPETVNAFAIVARAMPIFRHRVLLLNRAFYSAVPATAMDGLVSGQAREVSVFPRPEKMGLSDAHGCASADACAGRAAFASADDEWLNFSHRLRLRHECVHYETLRLFGSMENHALDEILADALGQLAAFGNFSADRQRLFFGLTKGADSCTGRLSFYCEKVHPDERGKVYQAVDRVLDIVEDEINRIMKGGGNETEVFMALAGKCIGQRLEAM